MRCFSRRKHKEELTRSEHARKRKKGSHGLHQMHHTEFHVWLFNKVLVIIDFVVILYFDI